MWKGIAGVLTGLLGLVFAIWRYPGAIEAIGSFVTNVDSDVTQANPALAATLMLTLLILIVATFFIYVGLGVTIGYMVQNLKGAKEPNHKFGMVISTVLFLITFAAFSFILGSASGGTGILIFAGVVLVFGGIMTSDVI